MNSRILFGGLLAVACLAELWVIGGQQRQLKELQSVRASAEEPAFTQTPTAASDSVSTTLAATPELLRLRSEVTRLEAQKRELRSATAENEKLKSQLAAPSTNATRGVPLPTGYIRKSEAKFTGYGSPQNTLQSFLWALQNKNGEQFAQTFTPQAAEQLKDRNQLENMMKGSSELIGMAIVGERTLNDGSIEAKVEIAPGFPPQPLRFRNINGEWKLDALQ